MMVPDFITVTAGCFTSISLTRVMAVLQCVCTMKYICTAYRGKEQVFFSRRKRMFRAVIVQFGSPSVCYTA
jgi:hypothetical protein